MTSTQERDELIRSGFRNGMSRKELAGMFGVSYQVAALAVSGMRNKPPSVAYLRSKLAHRLGGWSDISPELFDFLLRKIKRNETILACMARLVVQGNCSNKKE